MMMMTMTMTMNMIMMIMTKIILMIVILTRIITTLYLCEDMGMVLARLRILLYSCWQ